jgi:hypothetical protein
VNHTKEPESPPPDGGPLLFFASFFAVPLALMLVIIVRTGAGYRFEVALGCARILGLILPIAVWSYFSRSRWAIAAKSGACGLVIATTWMVYLFMKFENPKGDDVAPLFWFFVAPFLALSGGFLTLFSALSSIGAFWLRQRPRAAWLSRVRQGHYAEYRLFPLPPDRESARKPLFLRYRKGDLALARSHGVDAGGGPQIEVIARAPSD